MAPPRDELAPDSAEPVLGWRVWRVTGGLLEPIVVSGEAWAPGPNEAHCHLPRTRHRAPGKGCVCGFNALHEIPEEFCGDPAHAVGAIAAWGEVDIYRTGFRAQFACVLGLLVGEGSRTGDPRVREVAGRYAVPALPREELRGHAERYAQPSPHRLFRAPRSGIDHGRSPLLPTSALAAGFEGHGVAIRSHVAVEHRRRFMRVGPTPSLTALVSDRVEPTVARGDVVTEGAPLFLASTGPSVVFGPAPHAGVVIDVNDGPRPHEAGPARGGWVVELRLEAESIDESSIAWGRRGAEAYREYVLGAGSDADLLLACAENPAPASAIVDEAEGRAWLRAFAQALDATVRADERLCASLRAMEVPVRFEVAGLEALLLAAPAVGSERWARTDAAEPGREPVREELVIELRPDDLRRYWRGEVGLAPDHVSVAEAGSREPAGGRRNPLHLLAGDRGRLLLANSLHRRLFAAASAILDGLGNPWFKAGDAIADPVRNLEALAGFERPDELASGAA